MADWMDQGIAAIQEYDPIYGAGDTILGLGSHMLHGAARGWGGLITLGATGSFDAAEDTIQNYQVPSWLPEYHVQSGAGQGVMGGLEWFFTEYDKGVKQFTDLIAKGESPFIPKAMQGPKLASIMYTGYMAIPLTIGLVRGGRGPLPVRGYDKKSIRNAIKNHAAMYRDSAVMSKIFREANPKLWEQFRQEGTLSKNLDRMGVTMEKATNELNVVVDNVSRSMSRAGVEDATGALGTFHPPRGRMDFESGGVFPWAPEVVSGRSLGDGTYAAGYRSLFNRDRQPSIAEKNISQESLEAVFKDSDSNFILFETTNIDILNMFNERVGYEYGFGMGGNLGARHMVDVPAGSAKEMAAFVTDRSRKGTQGAENMDKGFMLIRVPAGKTKADLQADPINAMYNKIKADRAIENNPQLSTADANVIKDGIHMTWDWGVRRYGPTTGSQPVLMGSVRDGNLYSPKGTQYSHDQTLGGYRTPKQAEEGGPVISLNPKETSINEAYTDVPGVGRLKNPERVRPEDMSDAQAMSALRNIFGEDIAALSDSALKTKWKEVLKGFKNYKAKVKEKRRIKPGLVSTLDHELVHWRDYLEHRMLSKEQVGGEMFAGELMPQPLAKDWRGELRPLEQGSDAAYRSGNNPAMRKLSYELLGAVEKAKWNFNLRNEATSLNKTWNFKTDKWQPTAKEWSELSPLEIQKIIDGSDMFGRLNPIELTPRLIELHELQQKTGLSFSEIFGPSREGIEAPTLPSGVRDLAIGMRSLMEGDLTQFNILASNPAKMETFLSDKFTPLIEFTNPAPKSSPAQMGIDLTGSAASIPFLIDQYKPEWQGLINAGTNQITAGKLAAAGMQ